MRSPRRGIIAASAAVLAFTLFTTGAQATGARPVAQVPGSAGLGLAIQAVSENGGQILLTQESDQGNFTRDESLWLVDTATGQPTRLPAEAGAVRSFSLSPLGEWAAWASTARRGGCARQVFVVPTDGSAPPTRLALPGPHARAAVDAVTVADNGRVTIRVAGCESHTSRAILTADPGQTQLRTLVSARSSAARWPASQDGRVLAVCRPRGRNAVLTVVDSDPELTVKSATLRFNGERSVDCVASDAGTATMSVIRHRPGAPRKGLRHYRRAGVTVGPDATTRFQLPFGVAVEHYRLETASPAGDAVTTSFLARKAVVIDTRSGRHGRPFRSPEATLSAPPAGGPAVSGQPTAPWSPFASAIVVSDIRRGGGVRILDPRTGRLSRLFRVTAPRRSFGARACFLPSGRVLLDVESMLSASQLAVSDPGHSRFSQIDTSGIGTVDSVSCGAAAAGRVFVGTVDTGMIYALDANTLDESPLTP
jgi:hypothetical protein